MAFQPSCGRLRAMAPLLSPACGPCVCVGALAPAPPARESGRRCSSGAAYGHSPGCGPQAQLPRRRRRAQSSVSAALLSELEATHRGFAPGRRWAACRAGMRLARVAASPGEEASSAASGPPGPLDHGADTEPSGEAAPRVFGVPQRWILVAATSASFVLCNMDKVRADTGSPGFAVSLPPRFLLAWATRSAAPVQTHPACGSTEPETPPRRCCVG